MKKRTDRIIAAAVTRRIRAVSISGEWEVFEKQRVIKNVQLIPSPTIVEEDTKILFLRFIFMVHPDNMIRPGAFLEGNGPYPVLAPTT
ncbi:MAG: hypothetical protein ACP5SH_27645 [Syntrophobacteraceae bacterium]